MSFRKRRRLCDWVSVEILSSRQRMREALRIAVDIQQNQLPLHSLGASAERHDDDGSSSCYKSSLR
jgi:hypothetical protein